MDIIFSMANDLQPAWHLQLNQASLSEKIMAAGIKFEQNKTKTFGPKSLSSTTHRAYRARRVFRWRQ
jgi:hypothetical protein